MYTLLKNLITRHSCLLLATCICFVACYQGTRNTQQVTFEYNNHEKQRGAHIFGGLDSTSLQVLKDTNVEWITLVPFAGQADYDSPNLSYNRRRGNSPEELERRNKRWVDQMVLAKNLGFKVFLKPHIWMHNPRDGKWRSDIFPSNKENWETWSTDYRAFILNYAKLAEEAHADMFCVGTELTRLTTEKPEFWKDLTKEIKSIYNGELTYAANWYKEYDRINFWDELDYIGIQAYFPLANKKNPTLKVLKEAWENKLPGLSKLSHENQKPILFTEIGYKSSANAAIEPWTWIDYGGDDNLEPSDITQANCYQAVFETVWKQDWFAGMHLWQWRSDGRDRRGNKNIDFTPQDKKAQLVIAEGYGE